MEERLSSTWKTLQHEEDRIREEGQQARHKKRKSGGIVEVL